MIIKYKKLDAEFAEKNYPLLSEAVDRIKGLSIEQRQLVLGLGLEIALTSDGSTSLFEDEFEGEITFEDEIDF
jgi:hypothetical protein